MSGSTKDASITTPTARKRLVSRGEPYYRSIQQGLAVGYRRGKKGGAWVARMRLPDRSYMEKKLGAADDNGAVPDGAGYLSFDQAVDAARVALGELQARQNSGALPSKAKATLSDVFDLYRDAYIAGKTSKAKGPGRDLKNLDSILKCHLRPRLGHLKIDGLRAAELERFKIDIVDAEKLTRSGRPAAARVFDDEFEESEAKRKRKARANRIMTILRAALYYARDQRWFATDAAWSVALKPYPNVDVASIRYLTVEEAGRLKGYVEYDFGRLITGALMTGCRYGSLRYLRCADVDIKSRTALVRVTKSGESQTIRLNRAGCNFLMDLIAGRKGNEFVFVKHDGSQWMPSDQQRRMADGCVAAGIDPAVTFHELRDTFASHLVMAGVPLLTVSKLLGHKDTRTTEKYYAHLAPDHLQKAVDDHLPDF